MVNIDPEDWDTSDLVYRSPEHWQAVTVSTHAPCGGCQSTHAILLHHKHGCTCCIMLLAMQCCELFDVGVYVFYF